MNGMTKDEPHPFKRLVPGHPYCVEGLRPWESGISCGRLEHDSIHASTALTASGPTAGQVRILEHQPSAPADAEALARRFHETYERHPLADREPLTPAEARTGISDRAAAALADVADLRSALGTFDAGGLRDDDGLLAALDRIEQALRAGGAA